MTTQKAIRATIKLGDIDLDVFQMPDGGYWYSKTDIETSLGFEPTRRAYRDFLTSKDPKALQAKGLVGGNITIKHMSKTYTLVTQQEVSLFWGFQSQNGNTLATNLLVACAIEALERRADTAFGVQRSEQERNDRLKTRTQGKVARRYLTDSIADYLDSHPELPDNYRKYIWSNCSDHLNLIILGAKAKQAKEFLEVPKNSLLRNHIPVSALNELERVEDLASRIIDEKGTEPLEAVKEAAILMFARSIGMV